MRTITGLLMTLAVLLAASHIVVSAEQREPKPKFENEAGWTWHIKPAAADWTSAAQRGLVMRLDELKDEKLLLSLARSVETNRDIVHFRPVAFDSKGQRFEFKSDSGGSVDDVALSAFVLDLKRLARDQIKFIGIEKLTRDSLRDVVAPAAFRKLAAAGIEALPFPRIGERYEFELTTIDGKKISSGDLRGKVVLLDFWARWCGPCMAKMPKLKETYQKLHARGFEVIGLNHDYTLEQARHIIAEQKIPWPNALAPVEKNRRDLWLEATGTSALPRLLLIDRNGILRADVSPYQLEAEINKLMDQP